ncbi:hypothetical protein KIN20_023399 [Parelaphostrongylus tenuis]|uniref:C2H2-type domain-containing protein n=1 Tax=Parelaphostrongylus tenuis TaxID=148309 RepID=A0AAD5NA24_PARTN|nr:hypothetical protein KIN20_023399 [Parelaphostrongylus tenuis]
MDLLEDSASDSLAQSDHEHDMGEFEVIYSDNNGSFVSRQVLEQFKGRNRQFGNAVCPECNQSFVNAGRLERHLAVHQKFGAYLCPLCGKNV